MPGPKTKDEFRKEMAEAFAHILEEKGLDWKKEWHAAGMAPRNGITKACYKGCNAFWLSLIAMDKGYQDSRWVTMVQIMDKGKKYHPNEKWHLKAGSKAAYVEYWYPWDIKNKRALTWDDYKIEIRNGRKEEDFRLSTRYTPVFNAADIEGMPETEAYRNPDVTEDELVCKLSQNMGVEILFDGGDQAYYSPHQDKVHLPAASSFESSYAFNATALHELAHSTGHPSRLNRVQSGMFGSPEYAYEELVAEMCSCFMGADLPIEPDARHIENHKAYVQNWIQAIRDKPETLVRAIKDAQGAAGYMDWKAGLITEAEYQKTAGSVMEIRQKERNKER